MWNILLLLWLFISALVCISIINSWMRVVNLRKSGRFGLDRHLVIQEGYVHYVELGDGPPLVLLPDILGNYRIWNPVLPGLSQHFHCLALDYPGLGTTEKPQDFDYHWQAMLDFMLHWLDTLKFAPAHLVGFGYGGALAFRLALVYPQHFGRSVTIEAPLVVENPWSWLFPPWLHWVRLPVLGAWLHRIAKTGWVGKAIGRQILGEQWASLSTLERQNVRNDLALSLFYSQRQIIFQLLATLAENPEFRRALPKLMHPILHLFGANSIFRETLTPTIQYLKQVPLVTQWQIPRGSHHLHWQHPQWIVRVMTHFLKKQNVFATNEPGGLWEVEVR